MFLRTVNLNLIPILHALLQSRSVSLAADSLGLTQGAVSNALSRLRDMLEDPLLVRVGAHMELTPRAVELIAPTAALCTSIEEYLSRPKFDPATLNRTFVIATSDYASFLMAGPLLSEIERIAPNVCLRFVDVIDRLNERMGERDIDVAIVPETFLEYMAPARFNSVRLVSEHSVAVFWEKHPLAALSTVGDADLKPYKSIAFHPSSERLERRDPNAFTGGHQFYVAAYIPQVMATAFLLPETQYFSIEPSSVARRMARLLPLAIRPLAFPIRPLHIALAWSAVHDSDPAHSWLRDIIQNVIAKLSLDAHILPSAAPS